MRALLIVLTIAAALGSSACAHHSQGNAPGDGSPNGSPGSSPGNGSTGDTSPAPPVTATVCRPLDVDTAFEAERACPTWRHLGIASRSAGACPRPFLFGENDWRVEPLFSESAPSPLNRFCLYQYKGTEPERLPELNADLRLLLSNGQLERLDSTCAAVTRASDTVTDPVPAPSALAKEAQNDFERHFLAQAGEVPELAKILPHRPSVELTFLDTQPGDKPDQGNSNHGFTLKQLAERLICADAPGYGKTCAARTTSELALPILNLNPAVPPGNSDVDLNNGGFFGSVDQLARSVWNAIDAEPAPGIQHRVLNLSLAWDGARFGGLERRVRDMPAPVQALYRVLEEAACRDTLVLAAAGNRRGGFDEQNGPLLPAAWETRDAPWPALCGSRHHGDRARAHSSKHAPLLYAVGGIRTEGFQLANARAGGEPSFVAYGDHAVFSQAMSNRPAILTGSSVATAVVSATAAAAWNLRPELTRSGVMELLYRSGQALDRKADFHPRRLRTPPGVRRIAVCPAVADACRSGGRCTESPKCREITTEPPVVSKPSFASLDATFDARVITQSVGTISLCPERTVLSDPNKAVPENLCPGRQFFGVYARPWTVPQPDHSPCSACSAEPPPSQTPLRNTTLAYTLYIQIDEDWERGPLTQPVLEIGTMSLALDLPPLDKNEVAIIENLDPKLFEHEGGVPPAVSLQFLVNEQASRPPAAVEVPVFIGGPRP